ncbi:hypothetical protein BRADI_5g16453v3 [Brachypodium distachyon]|uniref:DUF1618 domain-containing protein n=1 Tax=Brachypodium distachyon TaxID=15368 RepID=A0A0Q3H659_BRADI|nr:hypothetical protein BRADI_5g16453v3 [Brachypodium distachyon]
MPKHSPDGAAARRATKRSRGRRFLYLVTDDWELGYSIRKVDLEEEYDDDAYTDEAGTFSCNSSERRLPPVVFRLEAPHIGANHFAAAFGTKIMALHHTPRRYIPVFNVRTRCLSFGPRMRRNPSAPIYVPISDKLFSLDSGTFQMLHPPPPPINPNCSISVPKWPSWRRLPTPPFKHERVTSHAVHPDGRTIFISISHKTGATFAFDTAASSPKWARTGNWQLPFKGRAHYDCELDAWVGLTKDPDTLGHLCSCDIPSTDDSVGRQALAWKLSKDKLFCKNPEEHHVGTTTKHAPAPLQLASSVPAGSDGQVNNYRGQGPHIEEIPASAPEGREDLGLRLRLKGGRTWV